MYRVRDNLKIARDIISQQEHDCSEVFRLIKESRDLLELCKYDTINDIDEIHKLMKQCSDLIKKC
jgi:hypothetical protein